MKKKFLRHREVLASKKRPFFSTAVWSLVGRSGGFLIPFIIAKLYGANHSTDAFFFSYGVMVLWISLFTHIFESSLIPYLAEQSKNPLAVSSLANRTFVLILPLTVLLGILTYFILPTALIRWGGWSSISAVWTSHCLREMLPFLILATFVAACHSILFTYKVFWMPAVSPLFRSLTVMGSMFFFHKTWQIQALTFGFVAGELFRAFLTYVTLRRNTPWQFTLESKSISEKPKAMMIQMLLQGTAVIAVNSLFLSDQWFAGNLGKGSLSLLNYADRILQIPYILIVSSFLQIFLTDWSDTYYADPVYTFWPKIRRDIRTVFWVCFSFGAGFWFFRQPITRFIYHYGQFSTEELEVIGNLFGWLSLGFIPGVVRLLCGRVLFVMKKSVFYCVQSWAELLANIILNIVFMRWVGIVGIAVATAVVYTVSTFFVYGYIHRHIPKGMKV